jgi:preprotein translocase subunit SecA
MLREFVERTVNEHYGDGNLDEIREALLRHLAFDYRIDREEALTLGADGLVEKLLDAVTAHYRKKRAAIARPFFQSAKQMMQMAEGERPEKLYVDFSEGRRVLRATVRLEDVIATEGQELNDALERSAVLQTIDTRWTEHLRDLDEVKEGVGLRAFGQKDPLIEYKMEAFRLFKEMVEEADEEVVGLVFKAGPLVQQEGPESRRPTGGPRPRLDARRATAGRDASMDESVHIGTEGRRPGATSAAERDPSVKAAPVIVERQHGRNEIVRIVNPATGEQRQVKYKSAAGLLAQGWNLVEE